MTILRRLQTISSSSKEKKFSVNYADEAVDDDEWIINIIGGSDRSGSWLVPKKINVVSIMGGFDNKAPSIADRNAPTISIKGFAMRGGSCVKLKQTTREKFVAFANQMKSAMANKQI